MIGALNKKALITVLFFLPLIGLGQDFDFHDIKKLDSEESFKKLVLSNLFSKINHPDFGVENLIYGYEVSGEGENAKSGCFAKWFNSFQEFTFEFYLPNEQSQRIFEKITNQIKSGCTYYEIKGEKIYYSCPKSKYKGKIAFFVEEQMGYVTTY